MEKNNEKCFVVSFLLKTEPWQERILDERFKLLTEIYNDFQKKMKRIFHYFSQAKEYKEIADSKNIKERKNVFDKIEINTKNSKKKEIIIKPFTQYGMLAYIAKFNTDRYNAYGINSSILENIASNAWRSWDKFLYGNGKNIRLKYGEETIDSYKIRIKNKCFIGMDISEINKHRIKICSRINKNKKEYINIPFVVNRNSFYETEAFSNEIREIGIKRKYIRGRYKYYIQFSFKGIPYQKGRKLGKGNVGIDLGPSSIAVSSLNMVILKELAEGIALDEKEKARIERKMDRSKRASNPDKIEDNGSFKKLEKGERWSFSNNYRRLRDKKRDIHRKIVAKRVISHNLLANQILALGDKFIVENNNIKSWQHRKQNTEINVNGKFKTKKRYGKSISNHSPSAFISILENRVKFMDGSFYKISTKNAASQFDFSCGDFVPHSLKERKITLSNGDKHQRDLLAAFNLQHIKDVEYKGKKDFENYDVVSMQQDYSAFKKMEEKEIDRINNSEIKKLSSFGL